MEKSLRDVHADVDDLREVGVLLALFEGVALLEYGDFVGLGALLVRALREVDGELESRFAERGLVEVLLEVVDGNDGENYVVGLGERRVRRAGAAHVDEALLEGDDRSAGDYRGAVKDEGLSLSGLAHRGHEAGEVVALSHLDAGLDGILYGDDSRLVSGAGEIYADLFEVSVLGDEGFGFGLVHIENAVLHMCGVCKSESFDMDLMQFQTHAAFLLLFCRDDETVHCFARGNLRRKAACFLIHILLFSARKIHYS